MNDPRTYPNHYLCLFHSTFASIFTFLGYICTKNFSSYGNVHALGCLYKTVYSKYCSHYPFASFKNHFNGPFKLIMYQDKTMNSTSHNNLYWWWSFYVLKVILLILNFNLLTQFINIVHLIIGHIFFKLMQWGINSTLNLSVLVIILNQFQLTTEEIPHSKINKIKLVKMKTKLEKQDPWRCWFNISLPWGSFEMLAQAG